MICNHAHLISIIIIRLTRNLLQVVNNWFHQRNLKYIKRIDCRCCNTLQTAAKIYIFLFEWFKSTIFQTSILHKHRITNFHKSCTIRSWMCKAILFYILLVFTEIIKYFRIWATWVTNRCRFAATTTRPPVFVIVIEEDSFTFLNTAFITFGRSTNFSNFCLNSDFSKNFFPNLCRFGIFWNAIFFVTNKTSHINSFWV